jgi:type IV secretion system protein VirD4
MVAWIGIPLLFAEAIASVVTVVLLFGLKAVRLPWWGWCFGWAYYRWYYPRDADVLWSSKLGAFAGLPIAVVMAGGLALVLFTRRKPDLREQTNPEEAPHEVRRANSSLHGSARWLEPHEAKQAFRQPDEELGYIPIAELYRVDKDRSAGRVFDELDPSTWGKGGTAELLKDPLTRGRANMGIVIAGSGSGKTAAFTVPACLSYRGSMIVNDPSGAVSEMTRDFRESLGHTVVVIDGRTPTVAFNALHHIDITSRTAPLLIKNIVHDASKPLKADAGDKDRFFKPKALQFGAAVLADLLYDPSLPAKQKTLREWRRRLVIPQREAKDVLARIYAKSSSDYAREVAGELMETHPESLSGVLGQQTADTEWLSIPTFADLLSEDSFDPSELCRGKCTVYTQFDTNDLQSDPSVARVAIGTLMRAVMAAKGRVTTPVPVIIDEMYQLKYMAILEIVRDEGRKYNMPLFPMWQSEQQIEEVWGRSGSKSGKKAWFASASWRMYLRVDDLETAKELSELSGSYTGLAPSQGDSTSRPWSALSPSSATRGRTSNLALTKVALADPSQIRTGFRGDEAMLIIKGQHPARLGVPYYYRRPEMLALVNPDPTRLEAA